MIELVDFFKWFDANNEAHLKAVGKLKESMPANLLQDDSAWVKLYREKKLPPKLESERDNLIVLPEQIDWQKSQKISAYFWTYEVTLRDSRRIPQKGSLVEKNILTLAKELDKVRRAWDGPLGVTSWYRPASVNAAVGGASGSYHIKGMAVDVYPIGDDVVEFQEWLKSRWGGGLGLGAKKGFVHLDIRNGKGWVGKNANPYIFEY